MSHSLSGSKETPRTGDVTETTAVRRRRTLSAESSGVRRKSPLQAAAQRDRAVGNKLTPRGHYPGPEIVKKDRQHLEPAELRAFFKCIPTASFWRPYFYIQYFYGCRLSEPALILDEDISLEKGREQIVIRRLKKDKEENGFREHVYALDPRVIATVAAATEFKIKKRTTENPFLFASNRQRSSDEVGAERLSQLRNIDGWQSVSRFTSHRMFCRIAQEAHIPEDLQQAVVLRHTRAVVLLSSGESVEETMHVLGHSSMKMTMRYLDVAEIMKGQYSATTIGKDLAL